MKHLRESICFSVQGGRKHLRPSSQTPRHIHYCHRAQNASSAHSALLVSVAPDERRPFFFLQSAEDKTLQSCPPRKYRLSRVVYR